jgi:arylsulfatase A-like enzyme
MVINELRMNPDQTCLGHVLTQAGYETGYIGKWHLFANQLGNHFDPKNSFVPRGPRRLGFDGYWAAYNFHHNYYDSYYHTESPKKIFYGDDVFGPDAQTDMALAFLAKRTPDDSPFFLMISYGTPHDP